MDNVEKDNLKIAQETIKEAYKSDDYVNWVYIEYLQEFVRAKEGEDKCQS